MRNSLLWPQNPPTEAGVHSDCRADSTRTSVLHINSSARTSDRSLTRALGITFLKAWKEMEPGVKVVRRDVGADPIPPIDERWIAAAFTEPGERSRAMNERLRLSDELIDEVIDANLIVIGAPMYNYGPPASLKGWIDQVARIGRTFSFDLSRGDFPIEPLLKDKKLVVLSSRGEFGFEPGGVRGSSNALDVALTSCAHYWGVAPQDIYKITIEYQEFKDERHKRSLKQAHQQARELGLRFASLRKSRVSGPG
jgi:FMN-dependent NADH-azoreductase